MDDGAMLYKNKIKDRVVITPSLRQEILKAVHSAHQGVTALVSRAGLNVLDRYNSWHRQHEPSVPTVTGTHRQTQEPRRFLL